MVVGGLAPPSLLYGKGKKSGIPGEYSLGKEIHWYIVLYSRKAIIITYNYSTVKCNHIYTWCFPAQVNDSDYIQPRTLRMLIHQ